MAHIAIEIQAQHIWQLFNTNNVQECTAANMLSLSVTYNQIPGNLTKPPPSMLDQGSIVHKLRIIVLKISVLEAQHHHLITDDQSHGSVRQQKMIHPSDPIQKQVRNIYWNPINSPK